MLHLSTLHAITSGMYLDSNALKDISSPERTLLRARMNELQMHAADRFRAAIRPIYGATAKSTPYHIGSAVLLKLRGVKIVLTAAHVVDQNEDATTTLYLGGEASLVEIEAEFIVTPKPSGIRDLDKLDFAAAVVPAGTLAQLGKVGWIDEADIATNADSDHLFSAVGFPNTINKRFDARRNVVYPKLFVFRAWISALPRSSQAFPKPVGTTSSLATKNIPGAPTERRFHRPDREVSAVARSSIRAG